MTITEYDKNGRALSASYHDYLIESLKDPDEARAYLNAALEDEYYRVFLLALRDVADAFGITSVAAKADLNRENIYKMLSAKGNPKISSLVALLRAVGVQLKTEIVPKRSRQCGKGKRLSCRDKNWPVAVSGTQ